MIKRSAKHFRVAQFLAQSIATFIFCIVAVTSFADQNRHMYVTGNSVNLRDAPAMNAKIVGKLDKGTMVNVSRTIGDWAEVTDIAFQLLQGRKVYVHSSLLSEEYVSKDDPKTESDPELEKKLAQIKAKRDFVIDRINSVTLRHAFALIPTMEFTENLKSAGKDCEHADWNKAFESMQSLEVLAGEIWQWAEADPSEAKTYLGLHNSVTDSALERIFALADLAFTHGCLDRADGMYRHVVNRYTGSSFAAFRDRARIGIDDVRAKRGG